MFRLNLNILLWQLYWYGSGEVAAESIEDPSGPQRRGDAVYTRYRSQVKVFEILYVYFYALSKYI